MHSKGDSNYRLMLRHLTGYVGYVAPADKLHGRHTAIFQDRKRKLAQARFLRAQAAFGAVKLVANL